MLVVKISEYLSIEVTYLAGCGLVRVSGSLLKGKQVSQYNICIRTHLKGASSK